MNKLFAMGCQLGTMMRQKITMYLALAAMDKPASTFLPSQHWPAPDHRNSTAGQTKEKPHIELVQLVQPRMWRCGVQGKPHGYAGSPQAAYLDWLNANSMRLLDPTMHILVSEVERSLRVGGVIVGGLVAAVILWLFWG